LIRLDKGIRGMGGSSKILDLPGGRLGVWFFGLLGFAAVSLAMILAILPPGGSANPSLHLIKVAGGTALFIISALILYERGRKRAETRGSGAAT
ncbi:MAG: hypothetical protein KJ927_15355, partial [Candidatus Eisenbacteria bacterium]|nr:hypothetical protein [Candidatus Eisenbacteria bacterium]